MDSKHSEGCHQLIKEGATLVESLEDVLSALPVKGLMQFVERHLPAAYRDSGTKELSNTTKGTRIAATEQAILKRIAARECLPQDLMKSENLSASELQAALVKLEIAGVIETKDGRVVLRD